MPRIHDDNWEPITTTHGDPQHPSIHYIEMFSHCTAQNKEPFTPHELVEDSKFVEE